MPGADASPAIGTPGAYESVIEERIEFLCAADQLHEAVQTIRQVHPYEEPAIDAYQLLDI